MNLLTICRKAGKVIPGFDSVKECLEQHTAKVVLISADLSPKTAKEVEEYSKVFWSEGE